MAKLYTYIDPTYEVDLVMHYVTDQTAPAYLSDKIILSEQDVEIPTFTRAEIATHRKAHRYITARQQVESMRNKLSKAEADLLAIQNDNEEEVLANEYV